MQQHVEAIEYTNHQLEAELIAAIVANPALYWEILDHLPATPSDAFYVLSGKWYALADAIEADNPIPHVDGQAQPVDEPLEAARQLGELYQRRVLAELSQGILQSLRDGESVSDVVAAQEEGLATVQAAIAASQPGQLLWGDALVHQVLNYAQEAKEARESGRETLGIASGYADLDRTLNGFNLGLYTLGGAPGVGKTTLALQFACNAAAEVPVVYVTYENTPQNLVLKAVCRLGNLSTVDVERGRADLGKLQEGVRLFGGFGARMAFLEGNSRTTISYIQGRVRQAMSRHRAKRCLVVVDYLQRMAHGGQYNNLRENVSSLTLGLRELANRLDSPVLAISSLSRGTNNYEHPTLEALKESGDVEYSSDVVLLLGAREGAAVGNKGSRPVQLIVAKNRFGESDKKIPMVFKPAIGDFREEARQ